MGRAFGPMKVRSAPTMYAVFASVQKEQMQIGKRILTVGSSTLLATAASVLTFSEFLVRLILNIDGDSIFCGTSPNTKSALYFVERRLVR